MEATEKALLVQYSQARNAMRSSEEATIRQALDTFLRLGSYKNSAQLAEKCEYLLSFRLGAAVTFGAWDGKPIHWHVVDLSGKMRMLLADDVVLNKPYNDLRVDTYWEHATLRTYLNEEFPEHAFTPEERKMLIPTRRENHRSAIYFTNAGKATMDKVFVLSQEELDRYLPEREDRMLGQWWWLRTPGFNLLAVTAVDADGTAYPLGVNVNYEEGGVRPALWILLRD